MLLQSTWHVFMVVLGEMSEQCLQSTVNYHASPTLHMKMLNLEGEQSPMLHMTSNQEVLHQHSLTIRI